MIQQLSLITESGYQVHYCLETIDNSCRVYNQELGIDIKISSYENSKKNLSKALIFFETIAEEVFVEYNRRKKLKTISCKNQIPFIYKILTNTYFRIDIIKNVNITKFEFNEEIFKSFSIEIEEIKEKFVINSNNNKEIIEQMNKIISEIKEYSITLWIDCEFIKEPSERINSLYIEYENFL